MTVILPQIRVIFDLPTPVPSGKLSNSSPNRKRSSSRTIASECWSSTTLFYGWYSSNGISKYLNFKFKFLSSVSTELSNLRYFSSFLLNIEAGMCMLVGTTFRTKQPFACFCTFIKPTYQSTNGDIRKVIVDLYFTLQFP